MLLIECQPNVAKQAVVGEAPRSYLQHLLQEQPIPRYARTVGRLRAPALAVAAGLESGAFSAAFGARAANGCSPSKRSVEERAHRRRAHGLEPDMATEDGHGGGDVASVIVTVTKSDAMMVGPV